MQNIEDFIRNNHSEFEAQEPNPRLWDTIAANLNKQDAKKHTINWRRVSMQIAAAVVIFAASWALNDYSRSHHAVDNNLSENIKINNPELQDAEMYYSSKINENLSKLATLTSYDPEMKKQVVNDIADLDSAYVGLKRDLKDNVASPEIIEAMIQNYRLRLEILESILSELDATNNTNKHSDYENKSEI